MSKLFYDFKDSCGCGFIANIYNKPSRGITDDAITALSRMVHRGAIAADGKSGDGCGFLFSMPRAFMQQIAKDYGYDLPEKFAVAMLFFSDESQKDIVSNICAEYDLKLLFYRPVPLNTDVLGEQALADLPLITQAFIVPNSLMAARRFASVLYLVRKHIEHTFSQDDRFYVASFSDKVISYKGLVMPDKLETFYLDLQERTFETGFVMFHQRFSTNTLPKWALAQPFRMLAHNGEINSIEANRYIMQVSTESVESDVFSQEEMQNILPILDTRTSDSGSVDNMFEFLLENGVDFFKAVRCMFPPAWQNLPKNDADIRAFYEYKSTNFEAWDGPAAVNITDGRYLATVMDRNGLRPAKYVITSDDRMLIASELGVLDIPEEKILKQGKLNGGEMIALDTRYGQILSNDDIRDYVKNSQPYQEWLNKHQIYVVEHVEENFADHTDYQYADLVRMQRYHNYTNEVMESIISPMAEQGKEETGSMGDDTPMACFSNIRRHFTDYFRQRFAQVTNPPLDPLREKLIMSSSITLGQRGNILKESPENAIGIRLSSPILSKERLDVISSFGNSSMPQYQPHYKNRVFYTNFAGDLRASLHDLAESIVSAVRNDGVRLVILDDRHLSANEALMPMPMVIGYVNAALFKQKIRGLVSLMVISGEVHDAHSCAVMIALGATAVYPYLLFASTLSLVERKANLYNGTLNRRKKEALKNVNKAMNAGLLKIMSKMGICAIDSYHHSNLFDIIGLGKDVTEDCFEHANSILHGLTYSDIEQKIWEYHTKTFPKVEYQKQYALEVGSYYKFMPKGEYHDYSPDVSQGIRKFAVSHSAADYEAIRQRVNKRELFMIRDFLSLKKTPQPLPLSEVEPIENITRRFNSAAMSLGSISPEAHEAIAEAMNRLGGMSNSGEGGEDKKRYGTLRNSSIKQIASGRFGVTPEYLRSAKELQIKLAQGAKPGEGGQLPGNKVTPLIASLRYTIPGITLISPPPHHDIYSIEDLAQLIFDLKQVNPQARVSVKLVSSLGVGTIAAGVAKAYADKIIISGYDGGTGAAQLSSIKHAGNPWELGIVEAHNALKANNLRKMVELQVDGGLKTGLDVVKAAILGAESFGFGTVLLSTIGCKILRVCHLNKCSVGIATQETTLREHFKGTTEGIIQYLRQVAQEVREILAELGYKSLDEIVGRTELLEVVNHPKAAKFDFSFLLSNLNGTNTQQHWRNEPFDKHLFEKYVYEDVKKAIQNPKQQIFTEYSISNTNRSFGAYISGVIAEKYGDKGLPKNTINISLKGNAGQSLGVFLIEGLNISLTGNANDYVGKGMSGGRIVVVPEDVRKEKAIAGNTCLYGATGGQVFIAGKAGERFAVRNSGALAVVEGTGDHACEYMTGGTVVILGETGYNFGAGMTGGAAFVYDANLTFFDRVNMELVKLERIDTEDGEEARRYLKEMLKTFYQHTQSPRAKALLDNFLGELRFFWLVTPKGLTSPLINPFEGN
ncbi:glutamate synthase (NADPH/NADH) large chain [Flexibacter flexilis DSM 6793]|uniref:Glutamate synthase (NADPH/NADH) large chain n=1 Tax=Flexibacter flexilis DSM 6793 TaxID=927664 RepID=A0A1I1E550_9BACT|nr:glutamate synthase large subunit [Flexibacter flexilis]SFB81796.1 glutamate synthase (NADPH/NADH) large chain [Flexibacter flexilis DSM 6793]